MDQETPKNQIEQDIQDLGGLPLTHDKLFREMFQWLELAKAFLRFVLPKKVLEKLDLDGLTIEPKDFLSLIFRETRADMIYRIPIRGREQKLCVYVLLEHKSYNDFLAIFQADQYAGQIGQDEVRQAQDNKRLTADFRLSPVLVILFHHGETAFTGPIDVADVYDDYGFMEDFVPHRRALLFDLNTLSEAELPDDPKAPELYAVLRIMQVIFSADIGTKSRVVLERLKPFSDIPKYRRLIRFLWFYLVSSARKLSKQELATVTETVKKVIGKKNMSTILEQLRTEGETKKATEDVLRVLTRQQGTVPESLAEQVRAITDIEKLDKLFDLAFDCKSLEEFKKALK